VLARDLERHAGDADVIDLRTDGVHAVRRRGREDPLALGRHTDTNQQVDDLVAAHAEEDVVRTGQPAQLCDARLDVRVRRIRVPVQVQARRGLNIAIRNGGNRTGYECGPKCVLVRVEEDAGRVVVARAPVRLEREDVRPDHALDVEVRGTRGRVGRCEAEDSHGRRRVGNDMTRARKIGLLIRVIWCRANAVTCAARLLFSFVYCGLSSSQALDVRISRLRLP
jgi:hypothetical protein